MITKDIAFSLKESIKNYITERDADIVVMREAEPPATYDVIGEKWGITSQRAFAIYKRELAKRELAAPPAAQD